LRGHLRLLRKSLFAIAAAMRSAVPDQIPRIADGRVIPIGSYVLWRDADRDATLDLRPQTGIGGRGTMLRRWWP